jgi:hypothetical protein
MQYYLHIIYFFMAENEKRQIQVDAENATLKGQFANNLVVSHTQEEFVLDFMLIHPPKGLLVNRIIVTPGHYKRIVAALQDNLKKFEEQHGAIPASSAPSVPEVGFKA